MIRPMTCPICQKPLPPGAAADSPHFPVCSARCRQVDFVRWSEGKYAIVEPADPRLLDEQEMGEN